MTQLADIIQGPIGWAGPALFLWLFLLWAIADFPWPKWRRMEVGFIPLSRNMWEFAHQLHGTDPRPNGVLVYPGKLTEEDKVEIEDQWWNHHRRGGYQPTGPPVDDQEVVIRDLVRPAMLVHGDVPPKGDAAMVSGGVLAHAGKLTAEQLNCLVDTGLAGANEIRAHLGLPASSSPLRGLFTQTIGGEDFIGEVP